MSNSIILEVLNSDARKRLPDGQSIMELPLIDDITVEGKSDFSNFAELVPIIQTIKEKGMAFLATTSNELSQSTVNLANAIDTPRWQRTQPFRLNLKLLFYTKTDAHTDVVLPATVLHEQSILTTKANGTYITPGISLQTMKAFNKKGDNPVPESVIKKSKLISIYIPGTIYIPLAVVESAVPTFSKQLTESGYPLWANVDLQVLSALPANQKYYENAWS